MKKTALYDIHQALGAKIVEFAGYMMPVYYAGIVQEHKAVRERVGIFDVSHMGEVHVTGDRALDFIQKITVNDASTLVDGQAQYSAMCKPDGGIVDDLLVYRRGENNYLLVINAANIEKDVAWMKENLLDGAVLEDRSDDYTLLAVQGPNSVQTLQKLTDENLGDIDFYHFVEGELAGQQMIISRTGYTGEMGFELYLPSDPERSQRVWSAIMDAGEEFGIEPVGLGARDTLRLEKGYCLYGNDITEDTNTIEAGLGWITKLKKGDFNGREILERAKEIKPDKKLVSFVLNERGVPRHDYQIVADGNVIGHVTSGTMSPSLNQGIGMGYVDRNYSKDGTEIKILIRDREIPATVRKAPLV